jgi:pimeloyl-ACP methyl ester carboxylesterase
MKGHHFLISARLFVSALAVLVAGGCATPVGVTSQGMDSGYKQIDRSALNAKAYGSYTAAVLHRYDLERVYADTPVQCLIQLHTLACSDDRDDLLFALAELSFLMAKEGREDVVDGHELTARNYFVVSAIYAYLFLARLEKGDSAAAFDRRFRIACDLYNRSLAYVIEHRKGVISDVAPLVWLPVGSIHIQPGVTDLPMPLSDYVEVYAADRYKVNGLSVRNRIAGMGTPLVLVRRQKSKSTAIPTGFSATVFMRIRGELQDFTTGTLTSQMEVYSSTSAHAVQVDGRTIPLEMDITTPIAYTLNDPLYWKIANALFFLGKSEFEPGISQPQPSKPGQIPVLWVHGTMSSPVWWAEMWNTLMADPVLRENYQHWFYLYDSGKPVAQSFLHLRKSIEAFVKKRDPEGKDPSLRQMVVIGHSQGGLLTKATAVEMKSDTLVRAATGKTLAELKLSPEDEKLVRSYTQFTPLPEVKRVIFISTPHRGSFLASNFVRRMVNWLIYAPLQPIHTTSELMKLFAQKSQPVAAATSLDSMSPENPALLAFAETPVHPTIKAHSIIAIKGDDTPPEGDDGVVEYSSAHLAGVESECVVRSGHSCQSMPKAIEEVRRILREHLRSQRKQ